MHYFYSSLFLHPFCIQRCVTDAKSSSKAEIESFHAAHFSSNAVNLFTSQFLHPVHPVHPTNEDVDHSYSYGEEEEDDGLGYYPDGVKRTLTDEQIAIFRHSEVEALRRAEAKALEQETPKNIESNSSRINSDTAKFSLGNGDSVEQSGAVDDTADASEDGEIETEKPVLTKTDIKRLKRQRARQRRKGNQKFQPEKKPDLRKRTWDVVEAGMDSLDYDDLEMLKGSGSASSAQRKQISYDD